jgi:hypothetical protein
VKNPKSRAGVWERAAGRKFLTKILIRRFQGVQHMSKLASIVWLGALGILITWTGCHNNSIVDPGAGAAADKQAITRMIQSDSLGEFELSDEDIMNDGAPIFDDGSDDGTIAKTLVAIKPIRWGREITNVVRNVDVVFIGDTAAVATITKTISGNLVISAAYSDTAVVADTLISKPFSEQVQRKILFHRKVERSEEGDDDEGEGADTEWVPVALTLVEGHTQPQANSLFTITSLEFTFPWGKDTIADPLATWLRFRRGHDGVPSFVPLDSVSVKLTISSTDPDTELAVLRFKGPRFWTMYPGSFGHRRVRMQLISSDSVGGSFKRIYQATLHVGLDGEFPVRRFHAALDVLSHGTLYDDTKPVSNEFWALPYSVHRW